MWKHFQILKLNYKTKLMMSLHINNLTKQRPWERINKTESQKWTHKTKLKNQKGDASEIILSQGLNLSLVSLCKKQ